MKVTINPFLSRAIEQAHNLPKLQNALDAAYNDGTAVTENVERSLSSAKGNEKKSMFVARESGGHTVREGKLSNPLRFIALSKGLDRFQKAYGEPSAELTVAVVPASLVTWLDDKFKLDADKTPAGNGPTRGNLKSVKTPAVPA